MPLSSGVTDKWNTLMAAPSYRNGAVADGRVWLLCGERDTRIALPSKSASM